MADLRRHDEHHLPMPEPEYMPGNAAPKPPRIQLSGLVSYAADACNRLNRLSVHLVGYYVIWQRFMR